MRRPIIELVHLYQFPAYFGAKNRAADVAADMPLTCRRRSADTAADTAADVGFPKHTESVLDTPIHMITYRQKKAPQKAPWRFATKAARTPNLRKNLLEVDRQSAAQFELIEDILGDLRSDHRRVYAHAGNRPIILILRNGLALRCITGQVVDARPEWAQSRAIQITITRIVYNAPTGIKSLSTLLNKAYRRTPS